MNMFTNVIVLVYSATNYAKNRAFKKDPKQR